MTGIPLNDKVNMAPPSNSTVRLVKLKSGEEIFAEVTIMTDGTVTMKNMVNLTMVDANSLGFVPYLPYCDFKDGLQITKNDYLFLAPLKRDMENEYRKIFNKVVLPSGGGGLRLTT